MACACIQSLMHMTYRMKTAVHPYTEIISRIIRDGIEANAPSLIKLNSLKLLSAVLVAREDVLTDYGSVFEIILQRLNGLSMMDSSDEVRKLALQLNQLLTQDK